MRNGKYRFDVRTMAAAICAAGAFATSAAPLEYAYRIVSPQKVTEKKPGSLNDGNAKTFAYWKGAKGVIECELPSASYVKDVAVTLRKSTNWYLMNEVEVAIDPDGAGDFVRPKSVPVPIAPYKGKSPTVDASCTNMVMRIPVGEKAVRVKVSVKSHAWGAVSEIEIDDGRASGNPKTEKAKTVPARKKSAAATSGKMTSADTERAALPDNLTKVENKQFRMLVTPVGGRALSLYSKFLDAELTCVKADAGTFTEFDWSRRANKWFYLKKPFQLKPFGGDGFCGIETHCNAQGGGADFLVIDKKFTLRDDSTAIRVDYEFGNLPDAMSAQVYGMLIHTTLGINGRFCSYYYPTDEGIVEIECDKRPQERWIHHPVRGWMAAVDDIGRGVAVTMPFREVKSFYSWYAQDVVPTLEWRMIPVSVENGKSYSVAMDVIAFKGLSKVSGAGGGLVGEIAADGTVKVFSSQRGKVTAKAGGKTVELDFPTCGEVRTFKSDAHSVVLMKEGVEVCRLEAPPKEGAWTLAPVEPSRESAMKSFDLTGYTNLPHQVCEPFAKPIAIKRPRVIALTGTGNNVELGFFADRFDCELLTTSISLKYNRGRHNQRTIQNPIHDNGDYFGSLSTADIEENLVKTLKKDADAILVGGLPWEIFPKEAKKLILEKVKAGCGLVWIGQDKDAPEIFRTGCVAKKAKAVPQCVSDVFADVPFSVLGAEPLYAFDAAGAVVHAKAGAAPYLAEYALGKGRVLHLPYEAVFGAMNNMTGITPNLRDFYPDRIAPAEYYYSLIAKCILRSADIKMPAAFKNVKIASGEAACGIALADNKARISKMRWFVRNRFGKVLAKGETPCPDAASGSVVKAAWKSVAYAGEQVFEAILSDSLGRVMAWGAWTFENRPAAAFVSFGAERDAAKGQAYRDGETVKLKAVLSGDLAGKNVRFEFRDSFGRLLDEKISKAAAKMDESFRIANELPARMYEIAAKLLAKDPAGGECEIDRLCAEVRARPDPAKWPHDDFTFGIWTGERVREYLWPEFAKLFREMNLSANIANQWRMAIDYPMRHGFEPTLLSGAGLTKCTEPAEYVKTGDKMKLVRKTCLSDPKFFAKQKSSLGDVAQRIANFGLRYVWFGDEQSLTGYGGTPIDFCFSQHCLAEFRKFLKGRYGTLEKLNDAWATNFAAWEDVIPFTRQEVWAEGGERHIAGWADHLEFMDCRLANSLDYAGKIFKAADPNVGTTISGTQPPTAYGGMDWWKQVNVLGGALSYEVGGQVDIHRSFNPKGDFMPWNWGYSGQGNRAAIGVWRTLFNGCRGITGFHDLSIFNPDWTWSAGYRAAKPGMDRVACGVGKHFLNNLLNKPQVAILYSQASIRASFFENRAKEHSALRDKYIALLRHLGYDFDFVSYDQLADGTFESRGYKAIILADASAMGDGEVAAIKRFVSKGGLALAEGVPARREGNCRPRAASPLADCVTMLAETCDTAYLKALEYPADKKNAAAIAAEQDRLEKALSAVVDAPRLTINDSVDTSRVRLVSVWPRVGRHGELVWCVISNEKKVSRFADFVFPKKGHLYDLVSGRELGYGDRFRLPLANSRPYAFELLDEKPSPVAVAVKGDTVKISASPKAATVVKVAVYDPSGAEAWYYSKKLVVADGHCEMEIPFAKSDAKGTWRIVATDVLTGESRMAVLKR